MLTFYFRMPLFHSFMDAARKRLPRLLRRTVSLTAPLSSFHQGTHGVLSVAWMWSRLG